MKLVIVESPNKCKTIEEYLGKGYEVVASVGHVRDLSTSGKGGLGVDVENNFTPIYKIVPGKKPFIEGLKKDIARNKYEEIILATDPDREGEAISWHLSEVLGLDLNEKHRITFNEITKDALKDAIKQRRAIDMPLVKSQETRRILDRIIGFKLSLLVQIASFGQSAGRVQSATLGMIKKREDEIAEFVPQPYYSLNIKGLFERKQVPLVLITKDGKTLSLDDEKTAKEIFEKIGDEVEIISVNKIRRVKESAPPFITSTLQQEAFNQLKMNIARTTSVVQSLFEGMEIDGHHVSLVTYIRTDSTRLSPQFVERSKKLITNKYGTSYYHGERGGYQAVQDAHEAIRPTDLSITPEVLDKLLNHNPSYKNHVALYRLIYNRAIASLMSPRIDNVLVLTLKSKDVLLRAEISSKQFDGYQIVYKIDEEDNATEVNKLPDLKVGDKVKVSSKELEEKFTQPPAHLTEAKIVKLMEESGIGRPSTYAATIKNLLDHKYIVDEKRNILITDNGKKAVEFLNTYFPEIMDVSYTANMEQKLDNVYTGEETELGILSNFYQPFIDTVQDVEKTIKEPVEYSEPCPICGSKMQILSTKKGQFLKCTNDKCHYFSKVKKFDYVGRNCPECGKPLIYQTSKYNKKRFVACSGYYDHPSCSYKELRKPKTYTKKTYVKKA